MRGLHFCARLFILFIISLCFFVDGEALARDVRDWMIDYIDDKAGGPVEVRHGSSYMLQNVAYPKILLSKRRTYGINLSWGERIAEYGNIRFELEDGLGQITEGQVIAIHVANGSYLYYQERKYGINLEFSSAPKYEWELRPNEPVEPKEPVKQRARVGLYNRIHRDYVVYCEREYEINLRWAKDCK